jgi:hypothetical protein
MVFIVNMCNVLACDAFCYDMLLEGPRARCSTRFRHDGLYILDFCCISRSHLLSQVQCEEQCRVRLMKKDHYWIYILLWVEEVQSEK